MSQFRIQRKLTEGSTIKPKNPVPHPYSRIKSLESKCSYSRSPKKVDHESLKKLVQKITVRRPSEQSEIPGVRLQEGIRAFKQRNVGKAMQIFKQVYKSGVKSSELTFYLGSCLLNSGKHQASIMYLNECLTLCKNYSPNVYLYIAVNFKMLGNLKQAVKILEEGLQVFPNFEEAIFYKAKLLMKLGDFSQAIDSLKSCLKLNHNNELALLFLGDCFRHQDKNDKAELHYRKLIQKSQKFKDLATFRLSSILIEKEGFEEGYSLLLTLQGKGESPQLNFSLGVACLGLNRKQEAIVYFESCLSGSRDAQLISKVLKKTIKMAVESCDFYEAQHQINRIAKLSLEEEQFREWKLLVEGVSDLIKRKNVNGCLKLEKALEVGLNRIKADRLNRKECTQFLKFVYPYLAYAHFITDKLQPAIEMYDQCLEMDRNNHQILAQRLIVEGLHLQETGELQTAVSKFQQSFQEQNRIESLFMAAITLVKQVKQHPQDKEKVVSQIEAILQRASECKDRTPLIFFYYSLFRLFLNHPCLPIIEKAIELCDEPISEYYFIYALALNGQKGRLKESIEAISKAVQIDPGVLEFYRQRSKYYFLDEQYLLAIEDCRKAETLEPDDEQIHLLLSFYLYLTDQIKESYYYLHRVSPSSGKLQEFEQALYLRMGQYRFLDEVGKVLESLKTGKQVEEPSLLVLNKFIAERYQYSQFSVYFYHLILSVSFAYRQQYQKGFHHLFGCLSEIQVLIDERGSKAVEFDVTQEETEAMLDEVKFNIIIMSLLEGNFEETEKYISVFGKETTSQELKQTLNHILDLIHDLSYEGNIELWVQNEQPKISDGFPNLTIPIHKCNLITKLVVSLPVKLKFTIAPEFDPSYLLNFDLDKIQYKITPPWLKPPSERLNFTNHIYQQSINLSESHMSERSRREGTPGSVKRQFIGDLKLDEGVEAKLKKILKK